MTLKSNLTIDGINITDLSDGSEKFVELECDTCEKVLTRRWRDYRSSQIRYNYEGKTYCKGCINKLNGKKKLGKKLISSAKTYKDKNPNYKQGNFIASDGYVMILVSTGVYKREHILKVEESIGREIKHEIGEMVHHIDLDRSNNDLKNLVLLESQQKHSDAHKSLDELVSYFVKTGLIEYDRNQNKYVAMGKFRELLEQLEEANQQPSLTGDSLEGSTTRGESQETINPPRARDSRNTDDIV